MAILTGLSGNEMFCLHQIGLQAGEIAIGNSVYSLGFVGSLGAGIRTIAGGEVTAVTELIHDGRAQAYKRMHDEALKHGGIGLTGVSSELIAQSGTIEFLSIGSAVHGSDWQAGTRNGVAEKLAFSTSADGQELYCQVDSGYAPKEFVFGNVAYSIGLGGGLMGSFRALAKGEVKEFSDVFNETRHRALWRITEEARECGANAVVGIKTTILPFSGMQEMVMIGTAAVNENLPDAARNSPFTSDLTCEEMWNVVHMGYAPIQLVLGVSVYSLGFVGSLVAGFRQFVRGEIPELTHLLYEARDNALRRVRADAELCGADDVVGIKTYIYHLGNGLIELMALGTAVKKLPGMATKNPTLPPQAVIRDKDTFINIADKSRGADLNSGAK